MRRSLAILSLVAGSASQQINVYSGKADGLSQHTIYTPKTSGKIPVLVWSSGGCIRDGKVSSCVVNTQCANDQFLFAGGSQHGPALKEATAHGVMIIAMGTQGGGEMGGMGGFGKMGGMGEKGKMGGKGGHWKIRRSFTPSTRERGKGRNGF
jgi:hypothetical protein